MLGGCTFASWGSLGRSWDTGEHDKGYFEVQAWNFIDFCGLGIPSWGGLMYNGANKWILRFWFLCFSNGFCVWIWMSRMGKLSILQGRCCENHFSQKLEFSWSQGPFFMILGGFGNNFHDFCCPGDWLEIWWLFRLTLGSPQIQSTRLVEGNSFVPGP